MGSMENIKKIGRRALLKSLGAGSLAQAALSQSSNSAAQGQGPTPASSTNGWSAPPHLKNPNILLVIVDQMRYPMWLNSSQMATLTQDFLPNIFGRIRNHAYEFQQYYTAATVCTASRATLLTGLYAPQTAVYDDAHTKGLPDLLPAFPTWASALATLNPAYRDNIWWFGKWHLAPCTTTAPLQPYGFNTRTYPGGPTSNPSPDGFPNEGTDGGAFHNIEYADDAMIAGDFIGWLQGQPPTNGTPSSPWCATVSLINPHDITQAPAWLNPNPFPPPGACASVYFPPPTFGPPAGPAPLYSALPSPWNQENLQQVPNKPAVQYQFQTESFNNLGRPDWITFLNQYYWLQNYVDQQIGQVLTALSHSPYANNTVVIFTSDHGEYGGSHGLHNKGFAAYDEVIRVPFYVKFPGQSGSVAMPQMCSSVDCFGLICDLATGGTGAWRTAYPDLQRRQSIWSFLYGNAAETRIAHSLGVPYILHTCDDGRISHVTKFHIVCLRTKVTSSAVQPGAKLGVYSEWGAGTVIPDTLPPDYEFYDYNPKTTKNTSEKGNDYFSTNPTVQNTIADYVSELGVWGPSGTGLIASELNAPLIGLGTDGKPLTEAQATAQQNYLNSPGGGSCKS
jgi:arylsulfatase A-like enzyme